MRTWESPPLHQSPPLSPYNTHSLITIISLNPLGLTSSWLLSHFMKATPRLPGCLSTPAVESLLASVNLFCPAFPSLPKFWQTSTLSSKTQSATSKIPCVNAATTVWMLSPPSYFKRNLALHWANCYHCSSLSGVNFVSCGSHKTRPRSRKCVLIVLYCCLQCSNPPSFLKTVRLGSLSSHFITHESSLLS